MKVSSTSAILDQAFLGHKALLCLVGLEKKISPGELKSKYLLTLSTTLGMFCLLIEYRICGAHNTSFWCCCKIWISDYLRPSLVGMACMLVTVNLNSKFSLSSLLHALRMAYGPTGQEGLISGNNKVLGGCAAENWTQNPRRKISSQNMCVWLSSISPALCFSGLKVFAARRRHEGNNTRCCDLGVFVKKGFAKCIQCLWCQILHIGFIMQIKPKLAVAYANASPSYRWINRCIGGYLLVQCLRCPDLYIQLPLEHKEGATVVLLQANGAFANVQLRACSEWRE